MNDSKEKNNRVVGKVIAVIVAFAVMLATSFVWQILCIIVIILRRCLRYKTDFPHMNLR